MNNFDKPVYCVYIYKDANDIIRYVGSGSRKRVTSVDRSAAVRELMLQPGFSYEILHENLTKLDSVDKENEYLSKYLNNPHDGWNLLNVSGPSKTKEVSFEYFNQYLKYDERSPSGLVWKVSIGSGKNGKTFRAVAGQPAGGLDTKSGYYVIRLNKSNYAAHRIVWAIANRQDLCTKLVVDHIDKNRSNNLISNLRAVTTRINNVNPSRKNKSGVTGVSYDKSQNNYRAFIRDENGRDVCKRFRPKEYGGSLEAAFQAAVAWRKEMEIIHYGRSPD